MIAVVATLVLLTAEGAITAPEPCTFNVSDGCRCHTDTMTLDISDYFKYPVEMDDPASKYNYTYSPCVPFECGPGKPAVLCQRGLGTGGVYALGRLDNSTMWYVESYSPLKFTIHYYNGDPNLRSINRDVLVNMMYSNSTMSAKFISEGPILTYHFDITGYKVVPQQEICEFDPTDSCHCHTNTMSLDISDYFKYPVEMMDHDVYKYSYSPCTPIRCGTESAVVCQESILEERFDVVAGFDNSTTWYVNSYNPLQFTIHYYGGDDFRNVVFNMSYENSAMSAKVTSEEPVFTYRFSITANKVVPQPEPEPGLCTFYPSDSCHCMIH